MLNLWAMPFAVAELVNRDIAFTAAWMAATDAGRARPEEFARRMVMETQGIYGKHNRPNAFRGAVAGSVFLFKQYPIQYIEMLSRMKGKGALLALAIMWALSGWDELPFTGNVLDAADAISQIMGYNVLTRIKLTKGVEKVSAAALTEFLGEELGKVWAEHVAGVINDGVFAQTDIDLRGSLGMGRLLPGTRALVPSEKDKTGRLIETVGVPGSFVRDAVGALSAAMHGDADGTLSKALPRAGRDVLKGLRIAETKEIQDAAGRKIADASRMDAVLQGLGFQPNVKTQTMQRVRDINELSGHYSTMRTQFVDDLTEAVVRWNTANNAGDRRAKAMYMDRVKKIVGRIENWHAKNPEYPMPKMDEAVRNKVGSVSMEPLENALRNAPKAIREALYQGT